MAKIIIGSIVNITHHGIIQSGRVFAFSDDKKGIYVDFRQSGTLKGIWNDPKNWGLFFPGKYTTIANGSIKI